MKISKVVCLCAALGMGATLMADSQRVVVEPSQGGTATFARPLVDRAVKGMPYSAEVVNESVQTLSDGNRIVKKTTSRVYRDVEGRVRREEDRPDGTQLVTISDPVAKLSWTLNPATKTARETPSLNTEAIAQLRSTVAGRFEVARPAGSVAVDGQGGTRAIAGGGGAVARGGGGGGGAVAAAPTQTPAARGGGAGGRVSQRAGTTTVEEALPNKSIENLLCTGVRRTTTIAAGTIGNEQPIKIVSEEWRSADLQLLVLTDLTDPRTGRSTYKLLNVRRADPDLTLFKVPSDYSIVRAAGRGDGN